MKVLLVIVHYFRAQQQPRHGSADGRQEDLRRRRNETVIEAYSGLFSRSATLDIASKRFQRGPGPVDNVDIVLLTVPGCSLLPSDFLARYAAAKIEMEPEDPRMLGFYAYEIFGQLRSEYDLFAYSEDDLRPTDPDLFAKIAWFSGASGGRRVLLPNRYEWNPSGPAIKTYVDGDLRPGFVDPILALKPDVDSVPLEVVGRTRQFRRARNPHAGFFAVTQAQLDHWMRQPHWLDRDCSFISPLESAATLGLAKTFPIFKPCGSSADFLELHHLDTRFSSLNLPWASQGLASVRLAGPGQS